MYQKFEIFPYLSGAIHPLYVSLKCLEALKACDIYEDKEMKDTSTLNGNSQNFVIVFVNKFPLRVLEFFIPSSS